MSTSANPARKTWRVRPLIALLALFATYLAVDEVVDFYSAWGYWDGFGYAEETRRVRAVSLVVTLAIAVLTILTSFLVLISYSKATPPTGVKRSLLLTCAGIVLVLVGIQTLLGFLI